MEKDCLKIELTILAKLYDSFKRASSFRVSVAFSDDVISSWSMPSKDNGCNCERRIRVPFNLKYLADNVRE